MLNADEYKTQLAYPNVVKMPSVLMKKAVELTADELATLGDVKAQHEADKASYEEAKTAYYADQNRLQDKLKADLEVYNGVVGNPKADLLWSKAWDRGHSSGLGEVITHYNDLVDLIA